MDFIAKLKIEIEFSEEQISVLVSFSALSIHIVCNHSSVIFIEFGTQHVYVVRTTSGVSERQPVSISDFRGVHWMDLRSIEHSRACFLHPCTGQVQLLTFSRL